MSDDQHKIIPFPHNDEHHLQLGSQALRAGEFTEAVNHFQAAYQTQHTFAVNRQLAEALLHAGDAAQGVAVAQEFIDGYARTLTDGLLYSHLLIESGEFVSAQEWLVSLREQAHSAEDQARLSELTTLFADRQKAFIKDHAADIAAITKRFAGLGGLKSSEQAGLINTIGQLTVPTFNQIAPRLMTDPFINQALRNTVALHYVTLADDQPRTLLWFDETVHFVPSEVPDPFNNAITDVWNQATDDAQNDDPGAALIMTQELRLYQLLLFPRLAEVVDAPAEWAEAVRMRITNPDKPLITAPAIKQWLTKLDDVLDGMND
ncbi:hypothetical protein [Schleiferilactobacillus shenzhenensis]|uniref:TPR repeat-containing protein n=1 Tax=Schleiferilactobacillus shenzhenensis LY-73 TaxID=1231336 RepID=U4TSW6_9LACO|nr:hypothetical protein [Schleiferilactobacillus shenzhenensis]ERL66525.1 hypothetical protein L248_0204 [Schleiferilactobacillus shenzhenensis LY-73]